MSWSAVNRISHQIALIHRIDKGQPAPGALIGRQIRPQGLNHQLDPWQDPSVQHSPDPEMTRARAYTEAAVINLDRSLAVGNSDDRANKAEEAYREAVAQQAQIAARQALEEGRDVNAAIAEEVAYATGLGSVNARRAQAIANYLTPLIQEDLAGNSMQVLSLKIDQTAARQAAGTTAGQLQRDSAAAMQNAVQAENKATRARNIADDLAPVGAYAAQAAAAAKEAAEANGQLDATLGPLNQDLRFEVEIANQHVRETGEELRKLREASSNISFEVRTVGGIPVSLPSVGPASANAPAPKAIADAQKAYDQALADARQVQGQVRQIDALHKGIELERRLEQVQEAQRAYDEAKGGFVPYDPDAVYPGGGVYTNGYDPTARLTPPDDFGPVTMSREQTSVGSNDKQGADGTRRIGPDSWHLGVDGPVDGPIVRRVGPGEWRVSNLRYYTAETDDGFFQIAPDAARNGQRMNEETAALWEATYQAANAQRDYTDAQMDSAQILDPDGRPIAIDSDISSRMFANGPFCYAPNTPQAKLPEDIMAWQRAARNRQELEAGVSPDGRTVTQAQIDAAREKEHDALRQVAASQAALVDVLAGQDLEEAQHNLDATDQALRDKGDPGQLYSHAAAAGVQKGVPSLLQQPEVQKALDAQREAVAARDQAAQNKKDTAAARQAAESTALLADRLSDNQMYLEPEILIELYDNALENEASHQLHEGPGNRRASILEAIGGGAEFAGGVVIAATTWETGVGAVAGCAMAADGLHRMMHGEVDALRNETTDDYLTQGFAHLGMDPETARRVDSGVMAASMIGSGASAVPRGLGLAAARGGLATAGGRLATAGTVANAAFMTDMALPTTSYALTGRQPWEPLTVQGGTSALETVGMSHENANFTANLGLITGGWLGAAGLHAVRGRRTQAPPRPGGGSRIPIVADLPFDVFGNERRHAAPPTDSDPAAHRPITRMDLELMRTLPTGYVQLSGKLSGHNADEIAEKIAGHIPVPPQLADHIDTGNLGHYLTRHVIIDGQDVTHVFYSGVQLDNSVPQSYGQTLADKLRIDVQIGDHTYTPGPPPMQGDTLVVAGDRTRLDGSYRIPHQDQVFLDIDPEANPDIISDIRSTNIPEASFNHVYYEALDTSTITTKALSNTSHILRNGGQITITTGKTASAVEIITSLQQLGFTDITTYLVKLDATGQLQRSTDGRGMLYLHARKTN